MRRRSDTAGVRAALVANAEEMHAAYGHLAGPMFLEQARRLRGRRELVQLHGWEVTDTVPGIDPQLDYLLDSDDSLTEV